MKHLNIVKKHVNTKTLSVVAVAALGSVGAHAELPAGAATAMAEVQTMVTDILAAVWPIVTALTVGFIGIKLFKKGANKAS
ncbi:major coat protein [Vibrio rumoiensis]|uniref:major coat protein n=1 Tax=Vibrio rumoiensis TaxID=76258 RepID=UPI000B5C3ABA|nr:major coat protein [Vibrio rumoiensis]